jgi:hypothetical protein
MFKTSRLARAAVAAGLFVAGSAFAEGTWTPELGFGSSTGKHVVKGDGTSRDNVPAFLAAIGYELDNGIGARVMAIGDFNIVSRFETADQPFRSFDNFVGVQATGKLALSDVFNLRGGVGIGRSNLIGDNAGHQLVTDGVLSLGLQWRPVKHYAMEVRVDHLTTTGTTTVGLQFQVPF